MDTADIPGLIREAYEAQKFSYAPYSKFYVGAALLTAQGIGGAILRMRRIRLRIARNVRRYLKPYRKGSGILKPLLL